MTFFEAMALAAAAAAAAVQQQRPAVSVKVDGVQVDVQVTRRGRPVAGLGKDDFELRDNGVVQRIESVTRGEVPLDVFLVLDSSSSVEGERLEAVAAAARIAVNTLAPQDRIALLTFSHRLSGPARLSSDRAAVLTAVDRMTAAGATSLQDALYAALVLRESSPHRALVIVFTDGHDTSSWLSPSAILDLARQTDAVVYGVTLATAQPKRDAIVLAPPGAEMLAGVVVPPGPTGRGQATPFLQELAAVTGGRLLDTAEPRGLRELFAQAVREMKTRYVLSYTLEGMPRAGWHALTVTLTRHKADVAARRGYVVPPERE